MRQLWIRCFFLTAVCVISFSTKAAQTNSWTNQVTGAWEDLKWSLGVRPNISQSAIMVTNYGQKAVIIGLNAATNFPSTMIISNLTIGGTPLSTNTVMLNYTGTSRPLQVKDTLTVMSNSVFLNEFGMLRLDGTNPIALVGGTINQEGGSNVIAGSMTLGTTTPGFYNLTNGALVCTSATVGDSFIDGQFKQIGGTARFGELTIGGLYRVTNGTVSADQIEIGLHGTGNFQQISGDVVVSNGIVIAPNPGAVSSGNWFIQNGTLQSESVSIGPGSGFFNQVGGTIRVGTLETSGTTYDPGQGAYGMNGGTLMAQQITRDGGGGFSQTGGRIFVTGNFRGGLGQTGGFLNCSNLDYSDPFFPATFAQDKATNIVTNRWSMGSFSGVTFTLSSGMLQTSNMLIVNGRFAYTGGNIIQTGVFELLGGRFQIGVTNQQFGKLLLSSGSFFELLTNHCVVAFADSSDQPWQPGETLWIDGWQGSTNGGGATRIFVGNTGHGLTESQLSQIIFNHSQYARQLPTGEIVPTDQPTIIISDVNANITIRWPNAIPASFHLQSAFDVIGPYNDVPNAASPFVVEPTTSRQFFRLH